MPIGPSERLAEPRVMLGVAAITAETEARAEALARANDLAMVRLMQNNPGPVPTPEEAEAYPWSLQELSLAASRRAFTSVGTPEQVRDDLERRRTEAGADEMVITTQIYNLGQPYGRARYDLPADQIERHVASFIAEVSGA